MKAGMAPTAGGDTVRLLRKARAGAMYGVGSGLQPRAVEQDEKQMLIPKTETNNVGLICGDCVDQRKAALNATAYEPAHFIGKFCKLAFPIASMAAAGRASQPKKEHMWVKVVMLADTVGKELLGTLANDPVYATQLAYGDVIDFNREDIESVEG